MHEGNGKTAKSGQTMKTRNGDMGKIKDRRVITRKNEKIGRTGKTRIQKRRLEKIDLDATRLEKARQWKLETREDYTKFRKVGEKTRHNAQSAAASKNV